MSRWVAVAKVTDVPDGGMCAVDAGQVPLVLSRRGVRVSAILGLCPHRGGPLGEGELEGTTVTCPWHGWAFNVESGACVNNPAARTRAFPVEVRDGVVHVDLEG